MPDYQFPREDEEFVRRNRRNQARKTWRQNNNNIPVLTVVEDGQENRTCGVLESELQLSPSGRIRSLTQSHGLEDRRSATVHAANSEPRMLATVAPPLHPSSFLLPAFASGAPSSDDCDSGALSVVSGYQSCAAEALRYLVEEEGLAPDDPLVAGLRQHLGAQQRRLDADTVFRNYVAMMMDELGDDVTDGDLSECEQDEAELETGLEHGLEHLASDICDAFYRGAASKMHTDEPEVRWYQAAAPPGHYEPMHEEYAPGAPSPAPSI